MHWPGAVVQWCILSNAKRPTICPGSFNVHPTARMAAWYRASLPCSGIPVGRRVKEARAQYTCPVSNCWLKQWSNFLVQMVHWKLPYLHIYDDYYSIYTHYSMSYLLRHVLSCGRKYQVTVHKVKYVISIIIFVMRVCLLSELYKH